MDNGNSEKKSEIWLKYCEACVTSKIEHEDQSNPDECCSGSKKESEP